MKIKTKTISGSQLLQNMWIIKQTVVLLSKNCIHLAVLFMYTFFNQWQLVNFITLRNWKISSNFSSLLRIHDFYCTVQCPEAPIGRRFLDRYRLSVNTFFMVSNGHSEFRYIALHLAVVASAEASAEASPGRHGRRHWGWRGARWGRGGVSCRRFFPSWAEAGWLVGWYCTLILELTSYLF